MKVLVLSSEKKDPASRKRRKLIIRLLEDKQITLLNPYPGRPPKLPLSNRNLFPQVFFKQELDLFKKCDLVMADLTEPDFKIGFLVAEAAKLKQPVLGLSLNLSRNTVFYIEYFYGQVSYPRTIERFYLSLSRRFNTCVKMEAEDAVSLGKVKKKIKKVLDV